jgi:hypothetical protein
MQISISNSVGSLINKPKKTEESESIVVLENEIEINNLTNTTE